MKKLLFSLLVVVFFMACDDGSQIRRDSKPNRFIVTRFDAPDVNIKTIYDMHHNLCWFVVQNRTPVLVAKEVCE